MTGRLFIAGVEDDFKTVIWYNSIDNMRVRKRQGQLFLNGQPVGEVQAEGVSDAWGYGSFKPQNEFEKFAPLFGAWSMLLHAEEELDRPTREALEALRDAEKAIDTIRAELRWSDEAVPVRVRQLTIDGPLIEWISEEKQTI